MQNSSETHKKRRPWTAARGGDDDDVDYFIASRHATTAAPTVRVATRTDPLTDLESLAGSDDGHFDDEDGHMSAGNGEADSSHRGDTTGMPRAASCTQHLHHARITCITMHHLHQTCITCINPAPPA